MARIGFIGLGHMGWPMAINLIAAGHTVTGFDLEPSTMKSFSGVGGVAAKTLLEAALSQDIIITMLQTGQQVKDVCFGEQGLFSVIKPNALYIDCSSIAVQDSRDIHHQAEQQGILAIDAPVSGGVSGAAKATLTLMVGGSEQAFLQAKPILMALGKMIIHTGPAGSGQAAKICNNMILGISMIAISEAFILAEHLGLEPKKLFEVVTNASGQCWAMSQYAPLPGILDNVPANKHYQAGFSAAMMLKDLKLSQQAAADVGLKTLLGEKATAIYQQFNDAEMGALDFSAIIKIIAKHH